MTPLNPQQSALDRIKAKYLVENKWPESYSHEQMRNALDELYAALCPALDVDVVEEIARAIVQADEQNGGPCWDHLMTMGKHVIGPVYDRANAAAAIFQRQSAQPERVTALETMFNAAESMSTAMIDAEERGADFDPIDEQWVNLTAAIQQVYEARKK